jgi:hypothetical protein
LLAKLLSNESANVDGPDKVDLVRGREVVGISDRAFLVCQHTGSKHHHIDGLGKGSGNSGGKRRPIAEIQGYDFDMSGRNQKRLNRVGCGLECGPGTAREYDSTKALSLREAGDDGKSDL